MSEQSVDYEVEKYHTVTTWRPNLHIIFFLFNTVDWRSTQI